MGVSKMEKPIFTDISTGEACNPEDLDPPTEARPIANTQLVPSENEFDSLFRLAERLIPTGFLPVAIKTPGQALAIILTGRELGIGPMRSLRQINIIQGKPSISPELMLSQAYEKISGFAANILISSDQVCEIEFARPGVDRYVHRFTIQDAQKLGLANKENWKKQGSTMLRWRCISGGLRVYAPDATQGTYGPEEMDPNIVMPIQPPTRDEMDMKAQDAPQATKLAPEDLGDKVSFDDLGKGARSDSERSLLEETNWRGILRFRDAAIAGPSAIEEKTYWLTISDYKDTSGKDKSVPSQEKAEERIRFYAEKGWDKKFIFPWLGAARDKFMGETDRKIAKSFEKLGVRQSHLEETVGRALCNLPEDLNGKLKTTWEKMTKEKMSFDDAWGVS